MAKKLAAKKFDRPAIQGITVHCPFDDLALTKTLKPHPMNPNKHSEEQVKLLAKIIKSQGIRHLITVSNLSGHIVSGHCRWMAANELGLKSFPVNYQDFKDTVEELAVLVADNKIQELSETDGLKMADVIVELDQYNYDLELTALSEYEIKDYVHGPESENNDEPDDILDYMTFLVTKEQRAEIEETLNKCEGVNRTEQLICLIRKK